jgi:DNA replication and repair protein RecF
MDLHLSQGSPSYLSDLTDYERALAQKNAFLKDNPDEDCPFDQLLIQHGSRLMTARRGFVEFLMTRAPGFYHAVSERNHLPEKRAFHFDYQPNVPFEHPGDIAGQFTAKLRAERKREAATGNAVVGPHRDEIIFMIGPFPAKGYGSQGEMRSAAIAVMLAAALFLESRRGDKPLLLLDEIFAELDDHRRENLAPLFAGFTQVFLTTATSPPRSLLDRGTIFRITNGRVEIG